MGFIFKPQGRPRKPLPLPQVKQNHATPLPSTLPFLTLSSSFGPSVLKQPSHMGEGFNLVTSTGIIHVEGITESENVSLQHYVANELGIEGLKELVAIVDVYRLLTTGCDQSQNIEVTPKQLLQRMGKGAHSEDRDQQDHLLDTMLYLSRALVVDTSSNITISSVLILDNITNDNGKTWISYHLGADTFYAVCGQHHLWFPLPTDRVLEYHGRKDYYILLLTFFLGNRLAQGTYACFFTALCMESGLLFYEQLLPTEANRTRLALRVISALLQLEQEEFLYLDNHLEIDTILAANYLEESSEKREEYYHRFTLHRLEPHLHVLREKSKAELRTVRRQALQKLLNVEASREDLVKILPEWDTTITFHPGPRYLERQHKLIKENEARNVSTVM